VKKRKNERANEPFQLSRRIVIHLVAAARPNFMKIAPLYHSLRRESWAEPIIVHTGQHYDLNMSEAFFEDLSLPKPDLHLGVGSGTHAEQTGQVMMKYEKILMEKQPDLVIVVGDVNSTLACALAASKITYPKTRDKKRVPNTQYPIPNTQYAVPNTQGSAPDSTSQPSSVPASKHGLGHRPIIAHLEAGLRSLDRTMPEEINRIVTDSLADILWTPSSDADENLIKEGISPTKIDRVGNIMIDSLEMLRGKIEKRRAYEKYGLEPGEYGVITLHRPSNVDDQEVLQRICCALVSLANDIPLIFPVHPRTKKSLQISGLASMLAGTADLHVVAPLDYIHFMSLVFNCRFAITDSGGIQEETTYLGIPCLTLRANTERPITISMGTNRLCEIETIEEEVRGILRAKVCDRRIPEYWDGRTATRVVRSIRSLFDA
jgi:UDP-N-acetylglucosamine 2-epimerase (non-hydrolysing)